MSAAFTLTLDTRAPASPTLLINEGAPTTGEQVVWVSISTTDYGTGAADVAQMKIWGDVDLVADPSMGTEEVDSDWIAYADLVPVMLSAGDGRKYLNARLRDDVGNETLPFSDFIDLDTSLPVVTVTTAIDRDRVSKVSPYDEATFTWECSVALISYQVRVVVNDGSPHTSGVLLGGAHGSVNVAAVGPLGAQVPVITVINAADLEAASPGDTTKICKVFAQGVDETWSA